MPFVIWRSRLGQKKKNISCERLFREIVEQLNNNDVEVDFYIADCPERKFAKGHIGSGGNYSCDYCFIKGETKSG